MNPEPGTLGVSLSSIFAAISSSAWAEELSSWVEAASAAENARTEGARLTLRGAAGSLPAFFVSHAHASSGRPIVVVTDDHESAAYLCSDVQQVLRKGDSILLFPRSDNRPYDPEHVPDPSPIIERADILQQLGEGFDGILVTSVEAMCERVPRQDSLKQASFEVSTGEELDPEELIERLVEHGFSRVEFVEQPGDLALRGGILDVFPFSGNYPVRIEFFGDEIDSIREFDIHTQRSVSRRTSARIVPNLEGSPMAGEGRVSLADYFPPNAILFIVQPAQVFEQATVLADELTRQRDALLEQAPDAPPVNELYLDESGLRLALLPFPEVQVGTFLESDTEKTIQVTSTGQPSFSSRIAQLRRRLTENKEAGVRTTILCDSQGQEERLRELLEDDIEAGRVSLKVESIHEGFEVPSLGLAVYTDHQIFDRYHRPTARRQKQRYGGISLRELQHLTPGDFVVHIDYGIGKFAGLEQIEVRGKTQEVVRLLYQSEDVLYVNVNALYKLHKYKGKEGHQPRLTKLGSGQWEKTKARTKSRVKDIARDLIKLYAERKASRGFAFSPDTIWQRELEASFQFEDTPDQAAASEAVKADMELPIPMDRLVCGDVGFGKTEIAIRAAFKAVQDGKQVAVLVPTTVLATQHYRTFSKRLAAYPVSVEMMSRFRSQAQLKETIRNAASGKADIVIGTHRLISKDVEFKDLGLLIIDEEQRFGVAVKERLRKLRVNVDTLTLTATPIPRTLQFSLLGARDLSIIATPPPNRQPIQTEIHTFDKDLIRDALLYETGRGGQVFFVHNRVQSIEEIANTLRLLLPDVRIQVGHGQMKGPDLERVMMGFVEGEFEVLVSTTIVENGLDIGNSNTIIINRADHFGLAELHQLRGRVGRSDRNAFCYLLVPSIHGLTREARQRLQAVEEFSDLGSGFHIAMRDLDIRGAGNMLGAEQSGFIEDVGYETYHRILDEAVQELRSQEFSDLFGDEAAPKAEETAIELDVDALIPETYLSNRVERLNLYRRISEAGSEEDLVQVRSEMEDRFGPVPAEVLTLLDGVRLKIEAGRLRLAKVSFRNERLFLTFPAQGSDPYFYEHLFHPLLKKLSELENRYVLKDGTNGRLRAIIQEVTDLSAGIAVLKNLADAMSVDSASSRPAVETD